MSDEVVIPVVVDTRKGKENLKGLGNELDKTDKKAKAVNQTFSLMKGFIGANIITSSFNLIKNSLLDMIKDSSKLEDMKTDFITLTGSVDRASNAIEYLAEFSARTPFKLEGLANSTKMLLGFGFTMEEIKPILQNLGDVSAALGKPLNELTLIFGQVRAAGKLTGERLLQLQERSVPIGAALAKVMKQPETAIKDLVSKGMVDFQTFETAMSSISEKGGIAFDGMSRKSETLSGKLSTLSDNVTLLSTAFGDKFSGNLKKLTTSATNTVKVLTEFFKAPPTKDEINTEIDKIKNNIRILENDMKGLDKYEDQGFFGKLFLKNKEEVQTEIKRYRTELANLQSQIDKKPNNNNEIKGSPQLSKLEIEEQKHQDRLSAIREAALIEQEIQQNEHDIRMLEQKTILNEQEAEQLQTLYENKAENERLKTEQEILLIDDKNKREIALEKAKLKEITALNKSSLKVQGDIEKKSQTERVKNEQAFTTLMVGLATSKNKQLAVIGKAAASIQMIMNGKRAVMGAYTFGNETGGPILGALFSGIAATAVAAQLAELNGVNVDKFATGGIVNGSSYNGDKVPINVNSGEMVLNFEQQKRLFDSLDGKETTLGTQQSGMFNATLNLRIGGNTIVKTINEELDTGNTLNIDLGEI